MASTKRVVVVTGGASGIGLAITRHFASKGDDIFILDIDAASGSKICRDLAVEFPKAKFSFDQCDISSWDRQVAVFKAIYDATGHIDIVMANAGISERGAFINLHNENGDEPLKPDLQTLDVNLVGTLYTVKLAVHYMKKKNNGPPSSDLSRGHIICTASNVGLYPLPVAPIYSASKHAVVGLVRSLGRPLEREGIQINGLAPSVIETNIAPSTELFRSMVLTPLSTVAKAVDILIMSKADDGQRRENVVEAGESKAQAKFLTGQIAEIHGENVTMSQPQQYVDEDTGRNIEMFWSLGYA